MNKYIPFIDLASQQKRLNNKIRNHLEKVLSHGKYIMGPEVEELETKLSRFTSSNNVITCGSGTDALLLTMLANNVGIGDAVFCPSFTFPATAEVIALTGATPIFIDVDINTFNISTNALEKVIEIILKEDKFNIKAILAVDLYGLPADYKSLKAISSKYNMVLIADAAQSFGAEYFSKKVGNIADITCVSFFPAKPLGCYGDGGAVFSNNNSFSEKVKSLRHHGKGISKYDIDYIGLNSRLDTIQAAILIAKLEEFSWEVSVRNKIAERYSNSLKNILQIPIVPDGHRSVWAQYTVRHKNRDNIQSMLKEKGITTMIYYPIPMHMQPAYKNYKYKNMHLPNSEILAKEVLSLPIFPDMKTKDQDYIISNLLDIL